MSSVIENNKLIAEFIGFTSPKTKDELFAKDIKRKGTPILDMNTGKRSHTMIDDKLLFENEELMFNKSWDWLIPVVREIHGIEQAYFYDIPEIIGDLDLSIKRLELDNTYKAVIEFIKWYNENK